MGTSKTVTGIRYPVPVLSVLKIKGLFGVYVTLPASQREDGVS